MEMNKQSNGRASERTAARKLHPEDICVGDDVALSEVVFQYPSYMWCGADTTMLPPDQKVQVTFLPWESPQPLKVQSICLPFVLCKQVNGKSEMLDIRQVQLVRLDFEFASRARKALNSNKTSEHCTCKSRKKRRKKKRESRP